MKSGSKALRRALASSPRDLPPVSSLSFFASARFNCWSRRVRRPARVVSVSSSRLPRATPRRSVGKLTVGWRSSGRDSVLSLSQTPTASTMTKWVLARASSPETACRSVGVRTRVPRPFICSKKVRLRTSRRKRRTSSGLMSVPVAIMSTVTAMRSVGEVRNSAMRFSDFS